MQEQRRPFPPHRLLYSRLQRHRPVAAVSRDGGYYAPPRRLLLRRPRGGGAVHRHRHAPRGSGAATGRHYGVAPQILRRAWFIRHPHTVQRPVYLPRARSSRRRHRQVDHTVWHPQLCRRDRGQGGRRHAGLPPGHTRRSCLPAQGGHGRGQDPGPRTRTCRHHSCRVPQGTLHHAP